MRWQMKLLAVAATLLCAPGWDIVAPNDPAYPYDGVAALLQDGRVLVTGPASALFDPLLEDWLPAAPLILPRTEHTATELADGRILVVGGRALSSSEPLATAEIYDPGTDTWTTAGSLTHG